MDTVDRIFDIVDSKYKEQRDFATQLGVTPSIVSEWRRRKSASYQRRLPEIAEALGTTTEYLLTCKKEPAPTSGDGLSPAKRKLLEAVDDLTDEQCEKLLGIVLEAKRLL